MYKNEELKKASGYIKIHRLQKRWQKVVTGLAAVVVFCTTYALILPAITLEKEQTLDCSYEVHQHEGSCFDEDGNISCGYADYVVHTHDSDFCYDSQGNMICPLGELKEHEHDSSCYEEQSVLACGQEENPGHQHDASCYSRVQGDLICMDESETHEHTDECYEWAEELTCGLEEGDGSHQHSEDCCESQTVLTCERPEVILHTHIDDCYEAILDDAGEVIGEKLICGLLQVEEHQHDSDCLVNPNAGIATMLADGDEETSGKYTPVENGFFLWLKLFDKDGKIQDIYSNPVWANGGFQSKGIEDALTYTEEGGTWYLIPVSYFSEQYKEYGYEFDPSAACPFQYAPDAQNSTDGLLSASYVSLSSEETDETSWYVRVQDKGSYQNPDNPRSNIYYTESAQMVKDTVSPSGTVINLFDYWTTEKNEKDVTQNHYDSGINENHALKFKATGLSGANTWTGNANVYPGIVSDTLGEDGYPHLSGQQIFGNSSGGLDSSEESLAYLFDPTYTGLSNNYREAHRNVTGLLQVDGDGYYYYDSAENYAEFDSTKNGFTLYDQWAVSYKGRRETINGQFFPFDPYSTVSRTTGAENDSLNHFFGMTLTTRFVQQFDGYTSSAKNKQTAFEFSGDDDVWIFIDGVLVADLGGIHDPASVVINFATGKVVVNGKEETTLYDAFEKANAADKVEWSTDKDGNGHSDTFANNTYHTLRFYYLERGSYASNLSLRYNLSSYPPTSINKVNQYGDPVAGAEFSVYPATVNSDGTWTYNENNDPAYTGVTAANGEMVFVDGDNMPYTLTELKNMFGEYFVLKETHVPDGYRLVNEEIKLHITNGVMMCENTYESGVWADATLQVTAPNTVKLVNGDNKEVVSEELIENGKIFAVVLKYTGPSLTGGNIEPLREQENWAPVYGTGEDGFTVVDVTKEFDGDFISAVIKTAEKYAEKYKESNNVFSMSAGSGALMGSLNGMPGDLTTYYYMLPADKKDKTQYTVAYYWTQANDLKDANSENTYRIDADAAGSSFDRVFGATINVPNLLNRLLVQKLDEDGNLVNGAKFAMYSVKEVKDSSGSDSTIYYLANDDTLIYLSPDTDGDNEGVAAVKGSKEEGRYQVDSSTGVITVKVSDETYQITPKPYAMTGGGVAVTADANGSNNPTDEDGTAAFTNMNQGTYYVREIEAPPGYQLNATEVMVLVDASAVYANAGTADDGVNVARGTGFLVSSVDQFASLGDIDNTLTWIYAMMRVSPVSTSFDDSDFVTSSAYQNWGYLKTNYDGEKLAQNGTDAPLRTYLEYSPDGDNRLFNYVVNTERGGEGNTRRLYTNVGWSYYELYQDGQWALGDAENNIQSHKAENAAYTQLTDNEGNPLEIANLFSRATYIQVTDAKATGDLEISKTVVNAQNAPTNDSGKFTFMVTLKDANGIALTDSYKYTVYNIAEDDTRTPAKDKDGNPITGFIGKSGEESNFIITLADHQVAVIENLPAGTQYVITEQGSNEFTTTAEEKVLKEPGDRGSDASGDGSGEGEKLPYSWKNYSFGMDEEERTVQGTLYWYADEENEVDTRSVVNYTNTYLPDLTILKVDATNQNKHLKDAKFVLYKTVTIEAEEGEEASEETWYYCNGDWVKLSESDGDKPAVILESVTQTTGEDGKITYLNIPDGTYYLKEVAAPDGYKLLSDKIAVTVKGGAIQSASMNSTNYSSNNGEEIWLTLTVTNSSGHELPETGGSGTTLYTLGGLLLLTGAGILLLYHNKNCRKEDFASS